MGSSAVADPSEGEEATSDHGNENAGRERSHASGESPAVAATSSGEARPQEPEDLVDFLEGKMQAMLQRPKPPKTEKRAKKSKKAQEERPESGGTAAARRRAAEAAGLEDTSSCKAPSGEIQQQQQQQQVQEAAEMPLDTTSSNASQASSMAGAAETGEEDGEKYAPQHGQPAAGRRHRHMPATSADLIAAAQFWREAGVVEPAVIGTLTRLARKHEFLADPERLQDRLLHLQEALPADMEAIELVRRAPRVVTVHPSHLRRHLQYVAGLLPGQNIADLLRRAPFIASSDMDTVMQNIQELGRAMKELNTFDLLCKEPRLLCADMDGQVTPSLEEIHDILKSVLEAPGDDNQVWSASREAILAHPRLLLVRDDILRARWSILQHAAAMNEHWRREMQRLQQDPASLALLLSRSRQTMQRLDFLVQRNLGQDLSLRMVLTMDPSLFKFSFEQFEPWCEAARQQLYQQQKQQQHRSPPAGRPTEPPARINGYHPHL